MKRSWRGALGLLSVSCMSCATVTIKPGGGARMSGRPSYQDSKPYFFWGLMGEHEIDVGEICQGKTAEQMQS